MASHPPARYRSPFKILAWRVRAFCALFAELDKQQASPASNACVDTLACPITAQPRYSHACFCRLRPGFLTPFRFLQNCLRDMRGRSG